MGDEPRQTSQASWLKIAPLRHPLRLLFYSALYEGSFHILAHCKICSAHSLHFQYDCKRPVSHTGSIAKSDVALFTLSRNCVRVFLLLGILLVVLVQVESEIGNDQNV